MSNGCHPRSDKPKGEEKAQPAAKATDQTHVNKGKSVKPAPKPA